jgi:hypothetical protein
MALTQVDLTNIVANTLPVANGGTGLTALGTAGQVLTVNSGATALQYSTPATTSPGGSTTQVQYNNAGAFGGSSSFVFDGTNVGIGTSSPSYKLQVQGAGQTDAYIYNSTGAVGLRLIASTGVAYVQTQTNHPIWFATNNGAAALTVETNGNIKMNSGYGSAAVAYGCRAWVNFDGNSPTIRSSGGVSSVTRSSAGTYTVNLSVTMPDTNYTVNCTCSANSGNNYMIPIYSTGSGATLNTPTTSSFTLGTWNNNFNAMLDPTYVCVSVFR